MHLGGQPRRVGLQQVAALAGAAGCGRLASLRRVTARIGIFTGVGRQLVAERLAILHASPHPLVVIVSSLARKGTHRAVYHDAAVQPRRARLDQRGALRVAEEVLHREHGRVHVDLPQIQQKAAAASKPR